MDDGISEDYVKNNESKTIYFILKIPETWKSFNIYLFQTRLSLKGHEEIMLLDFYSYCFSFLTRYVDSMQPHFFAS